jgi:SagB-type dehydrogenase family enzyme
VSSPRSGAIDLNALVRLMYFSNGVTRVLRGMAFRAAACTGALFHIELYVLTARLVDLEAGVYHYGAHDNGLRQLRQGDFRQRLIEATGGEPCVDAPVIMVLTSTWWRNAWKYEARAYRHAFWDSGTILANLLAVAHGQRIPARVVVGFADADVNALLDVDPEQEGALALVAVGNGAPFAPASPAVVPLNLPTRPLSAQQVDYPEIRLAHAASSLGSGAAAAAWRGAVARRPAQAESEERVGEPVVQRNSEPSLKRGGEPVEQREPEPVEAVILRRGSSRRFSHAPVMLHVFESLLAEATAPVSMDAPVVTDLYLIVNAVEDLAAGIYVFNRVSRRLELLRAGNFRREATFLDLGQALAGDAAFDAYWLVNLDALDERGYRAAQLSAAIEAGQLYLAAYRRGLGATGLTFFDDDVIRFFEPHAAGKSVMFLTAVGHPRSIRGSP